MKTNKLMVVVLAAMSFFTAACGNSDQKAKRGADQTAAAGHDKAAEKMNKYENGLGQAVDQSGHLITGCPSHKEMIGLEGDKCPKCGYMKMIPITWSLKGIDTVRVTDLADYHPPVEK